MILATSIFALPSVVNSLSIISIPCFVCALSGRYSVSSFIISTFEIQVMQYIHAIVKKTKKAALLLTINEASFIINVSAALFFVLSI